MSEKVLKEEMPGGLSEIGWLWTTSPQRRCVKHKKKKGLQRIGIKVSGRKKSKPKDPVAGKSLAGPSHTSF